MKRNKLFAEFTLSAVLLKPFVRLGGLRVTSEGLRMTRFRAGLAVLFCVLLGAGLCEKASRELRGEPATPQSRDQRISWTASLEDGFPDGARLDDAEDRENFTRWLVFLAEAEYYREAEIRKSKFENREEVNDCAALVRYAFRNALVAHTPAWRRAAALPYDPGFGDVKKFAYPQWPLGRGLFLTRDGTLSEFADSATLLHYNTFKISGDFHAARPGDLLFFYHSTARQPFHTMLFVGRSYFQPNGSAWIVYHTGDLGAGQGEIRELDESVLNKHPDPSWRPISANPHFLGVYRFEILR